jgi:hypothetical protein
MPYIHYVHNEDPSWHMSMDSIVLNTYHGLDKLFIAMMDLNK